jgi:hypothetical protein
VAPELARLTRALNITSHHAVLDGTYVPYLYKEDPPTWGIQLASAIKTAAARAPVAIGGTTPNHHVIPRSDHPDQTACPADRDGSLT